MADEPSDSQDHRDLVQVFDTQQESEALVVQGLLNSMGIEALISSLDAPQDVLPGVGGVIIRVAADRADAARGFIKEFRRDSERSDQKNEEETTADSGSEGLA